MFGGVHLDGTKLAPQLVVRVCWRSRLTGLRSMRMSGGRCTQGARFLVLLAIVVVVESDNSGMETGEIIFGRHWT